MKSKSTKMFVAIIATIILGSALLNYSRKSESEQAPVQPAPVQPHHKRGPGVAVFTNVKADAALALQQPESRTNLVIRVKSNL